MTFNNKIRRINESFTNLSNFESSDEFKHFFMFFEPERIYHVYNRGNNNQKIFFINDNYYFFLRKIKKHLTKYCELLAYCLMPNHFHFMIYTKAIDEINSSDDLESFFSLI